MNYNKTGIAITMLKKKISEHQDTINELKNTIERQEILLNKMKECYNCKHYDEILECCINKNRDNCCNFNTNKWELAE